MGIYLNPTTVDFQESLNSKIYVDKSLLIRETNSSIGTEQKLMCVSRPRRFGKSMAVKMLSAYYSAGMDSRALFDGLKISGDLSYNEYINKYNVIRINMQSFVSMTKSVDEMLDLLQSELLAELRESSGTGKTRLVLAMMDVYARTGRQFVILIDEWDCLFREYKEDTEAQKKYLDFLRNWMKDHSYVALAYMTGILPIKKYGTHSALNMFTEYSMTNPRGLAPYFGFTEKEVASLCREYKMNFAEARSWYDGYELSCAVPADYAGNSKWNTAESTVTNINVPIGDFEIREGTAAPRMVYSMYNPKAVVEAMLSRQFDSYWNQTETYEALKIYIQMNMDGLKDAVVNLLAGERIKIDITTFTNDMITFSNRDDILALLIHLGYLSYNWEEKTVRIPNKEVSEVYVSSIKTMNDWGEVARSVAESEKLLTTLWEQDGETVAAGIDRAHEEISILEYNDENSLSCCIHLAFYFAREYYNIFRELPTGKGFADVVYVPRPLHLDKPAVVIELKKDLSAGGAIAQIREKRYCDSLKDYHGNLLLCGINYDSKTKKHSCVIEKLEKKEKKLCLSQQEDSKIT